MYLFVGKILQVSSYKINNIMLWRSNWIVDSGGLPSHWDPQPIGADGKQKLCHIVKVDKNTEEYKRASKKFQDTLSPSACTIVEIRRIQNPQLFKQYSTMKAIMKDNVSSNYQLERELFHGTKKETCDKINHQGFNRMFAGTNGTVCICCMSLHTSAMITINVTRCLWHNFMCLNLIN